jgi:hypothetical protein
MIKKYELLQDGTTDCHGLPLYRIRALIDFGEVKAGDIGGYIGSAGCLQNKFDAEITDTSWVYDNSAVDSYSTVANNSSVSKNSSVIMSNIWNSKIIRSNLADGTWICNSVIKNSHLVNRQVENKTIIRNEDRND